VSLTYPVVLKPLTKSDAWERRYKKAYRFDAFAPLQQFMSGIDSAPSIIVQEWIDGSDSDVYFTLVYRDQSQQTCASFTGRKIRQWPPQVGGTASCTAAPEFEQELSALTTRFFDAVGFVGMGSMEFKRDQRSGRFVMVEPTVGRSDYQEEVATLNGVNVVRATYRSLAGLPALTQARGGRLTIWRDAAGDERSKLAQPSLQIPSEVANAVYVDALFRMNDPGPWLAERVSHALARIGLRKT
jgi:predicted ATP-grasp superfamily ATP-dependent carboligase